MNRHRPVLDFNIYPVLKRLESRTRGVVEREVDAKLFLEGDLVKVLPGAKIPANGSIECGAPVVDESTLTKSLYLCPKTKWQGRGRHVDHANTLRLRLFNGGEKSARHRLLCC